MNDKWVELLAYHLTGSGCGPHSLFAIEMLGDGSIEFRLGVFNEYKETIRDYVLCKKYMGCWFLTGRFTGTSQTHNEELIERLDKLELMLMEELTKPATA